MDKFQNTTMLNHIKVNTFLVKNTLMSAMYLNDKVKAKGDK